MFDPFWYEREREKKEEELKEFIYLLVEVIRAAAETIAPFMPHTAELIIRQIGKENYGGSVGHLLEQGIAKRPGAKGATHWQAGNDQSLHSGLGRSDQKIADI